ncbi:BglG family transcription antiterminator [Macrococcoides canis]|uniref:BglG family transcription antiterminator n=1 Tax=Macrococcoides canis TaxID=1855823 RepID=UPI0020B660F5|nr:BglG family transcription antiterminator [Macrococcus canis]UTH12001.1 transcription antiterminator [Macrococcus canis]
MELTQRQKEMLKYMISENKTLYTIDELTTIFNLSDKTVRNDIKVLKTFSDEIEGINIYSKRGSGVHVEVDKVNTDRLFNELDKLIYSDSKALLSIQIAERLLKENQEISIKTLVAEFNSNQYEIKACLKTIKAWLERFEIELIVKKGQGIRLIGEEINIRNAIKFVTSLSYGENQRDFLKSFFGIHEYRQVEMIISRYRNRFSEEQRTQFLLHVLIMLNRLLNNKKVEYKLYKDIQIDEIIEEIANRLSEVFVIKIPYAEKYFLNLHLPGQSFKVSEDESISQIVNDFIIAMKNEAMIDFQDDIILINGLTTHLKTTFFNLSNNLEINNPLIYEIKTRYPFIYSSVVNSYRNLSDLVKLPESELGYIALHFQAAYERLKINNQKNIIIVCHLGIGISQMLKIKLEQKYSNIKVLGVIGLNDLPLYLENNEIDLIITTVEITECDIDYVKVSPLLDDDDERILNRYFDQGTVSSGRYSTDMIKFMQPFLIFTNNTTSDRYKIIEEIGKKLIGQNLVQHEFIKSVAGREYLSSTCIGSGIAIPHGKSEYVLKSSISVYTLNHPIDWGEESVDLVFLIALKEEDKKYYQNIYRELHTIMQDKLLLRKIKTEKSSLKFLKLFKDKKLPE